MCACNGGFRSAAKCKECVKTGHKEQTGRCPQSKAGLNYKEPSMTAQEFGNYCEDYGKIMHFSLYMYVYIYIHIHVFHTHMYTHMYFYSLDTIHCQI